MESGCRRQTPPFTISLASAREGAQGLGDGRDVAGQRRRSRRPTRNSRANSTVGTAIAGGTSVFLKTL